MWCWIRFADAQLLWWRRRTLDANGSALTETKSPLSKCATSWASGTKTLTTARETASSSAPTFPNAPTKERFRIIASILMLSIESNSVCNFCWKQYDSPVMEGDHKAPRSKAGTSHKRNLQLLCPRRQQTQRKFILARSHRPSQKTRNR